MTIRSLDDVGGFDIFLNGRDIKSYVMEVGTDSTFLPSNTEEAAIAVGCRWLLQAGVVKSIIFP